MRTAKKLTLGLVQLSLLLGITGTAAWASRWDECKKAGDKAYEAGDYAEAEKQFQEALKEAETFNDNDKRRATATYNLALCLQTEERYEEAEPLYTKALELLAKAYGENSDRILHVHNQMAELRKAQNNMGGAAECYQKALSVAEKGMADKPEFAAELDTVADFYNDQEEFAKAEPLYKQALEVSSKTIGPDKPETGKRQSRLAEFYYNQGQYTQAQPFFEAALKIADGDMHDGPESGRLCLLMGNFYKEQAKHALAEAHYRRAASIAERQGSHDVPLIETNLGCVLDAQKKYSLAVPVYEDALKRLADLNDTPTLLLCLKNYQKNLTAQNKKLEAEKISVRIKEVRAKITPPVTRITEIHTKKNSPKTSNPANKK